MTLEQLSQLGPVATGLAATVALIVGTITVLQKARADRRDQWWKRAQWALDRALSDDTGQQDVGLAVLGYLADSKLAGKDEAKMLESAWELLLGSVEPAASLDSGREFEVVLEDEMAIGDQADLAVADEEPPRQD